MEEMFAIFETREEANQPSMEYMPHDPSFYTIDKVLELLKSEETNNLKFLDLGSGTGWVLYRASSEFKAVTGIEINSKLADISIENLKKLGIRNFDIMNFDINDIESKFLDGFDVFYMYNPFQGKTMKTFAEKLHTSIERKKRRVFIVYATPVCRKLFDDDSLLKLYKIWNSVVIYTNIIN